MNDPVATLNFNMPGGTNSWQWAFWGGGGALAAKYVFHKKWLIGFAVGIAGLYIVSAIQDSNA